MVLYALQACSTWILGDTFLCQMKIGFDGIVAVILLKTELSQPLPGIQVRRDPSLRFCDRRLTRPGYAIF